MSMPSLERGVVVGWRRLTVSCGSFQLALRAGNEKEEGETADTVGCCSLRVEHIKLHPKLDGQENVVEFDFLGKDSIRYYNKVSVEKPVSVASVVQRGFGSLGGGPKSTSETCVSTPL